MRVFLSINFSQDVLEKIFDVCNILKAHIQTGNIIDKSNLHLTLFFIGEVSPSQISIITNALHQVKCKKFRLQFNGVGEFKRDNGYICWLGIKNNKALNSLYTQISDIITECGIIGADKKKYYKPHITIGKGVKFRDNFYFDELSKSIPEIQYDVDKFYLMKSERMNGVSSYTEIFSKELL